MKRYFFRANCILNSGSPASRRWTPLPITAWSQWLLCEELSIPRDKLMACILYVKKKYLLFGLVISQTWNNSLITRKNIWEIQLWLTLRKYLVSICIKNEGHEQNQKERCFFNVLLGLLVAQHMNLVQAALSSHQAYTIPFPIQLPANAPRRAAEDDANI